MIWKRLLIAALIIGMPLGAIYLMANRNQEMTGKIIQYEHKRMAFTGEEVTALTLIGDNDGANYFLAVQGRDEKIGPSDHLKVWYSASIVVCRRTDPKGNDWSYFLIRRYEIITKAKPSK